MRNVRTARIRRRGLAVAVGRIRRLFVRNQRRHQVPIGQFVWRWWLVHPNERYCLPRSGGVLCWCPVSLVLCLRPLIQGNALSPVPYSYSYGSCSCSCLCFVPVLWWCQALGDVECAV